MQAALADAAAGVQDDEAEGEAADDAGVGERGMTFLQAADPSPLMYVSYALQAADTSPFTYVSCALKGKCMVWSYTCM